MNQFEYPSFEALAYPNDRRSTLNIRIDRLSLRLLRPARWPRFESIPYNYCRYYSHQWRSSVSASVVAVLVTVMVAEIAGQFDMIGCPFDYSNDVQWSEILVLEVKRGKCKHFRKLLKSEFRHASE